VEFSFFYNSAGETRPRKNDGLLQLQGAPIRAVTSLARPAGIQDGTCSWGAEEMSPPVHRSSVPTWVKRRWLERWDPCGAGGRLLAALLCEQMGCLGQKSAAFGSDVPACNGLQMVPSPPLLGHKSSGTEAVPSLRARVGISILV